MAAQSNVTLNTVVYVPTGVVNQQAGWINRADGVPGKFSPVLVSVAPPLKNGTTFLSTATLALPIVQATDTDCACAGTVLRTNTYKVQGVSPDSGTTAEREDAYLRFKDLVASTPFHDAFVNLISTTS